MRPYGRIFFRGFSQGIPGPHRNRGRGLRPLSFAVNMTRAEERMVIGTSEKLTQEGLRGNSDRLAEGKRVGSGVREVSHDLERMRGAGSLLHRRKRRRNPGVRRFRLCEEPRRAVLRDQKIDFLLRLVPDIVESA